MLWVMLHTPQQRTQDHHPTSIHPRPRRARELSSLLPTPTPATRARRCAAAIAAATAALMTVGVAAATAANPVPCSAIGGGKYNCQFYVAGDGKSGGAPVQAGNATVGYLHKGTNWVLCQQVGGRVNSGKYFNNNWAWTSPTTTATVGSTRSTPRAATTTAPSAAASRTATTPTERLPAAAARPLRRLRPPAVVASRRT